MAAFVQSRTEATSESIMDIEIIQVTDPWNFQAREMPDSARSQEYQQFQKMHSDMNQYFSQLVDAELYRGNEGDICAALRQEDNLWHRVRIDTIISRSHGQQACCYMIDTGLQLKVSTVRLMKLPKMFQEFPHQVYNCSLWGVKPLTLTIVETDQGLSAISSPCSKWDPAAVDYMRKTIEGSQRCQAEIVNKDLENTLFMKLYFNTRARRVCFNEALVNKKYAVQVDTSGVDLMCEKLTGYQDIALNDRRTSLASFGIQPSSQSEQDDMPDLVSDYQTDPRQKCLPTVKDSITSMSFNRNGLFGIGKHEKSLEHQQSDTDSLLSPRTNNIEMNTVKISTILPNSEFRSSLKSSIQSVGHQSVLHNRNSDAAMGHLLSDHTRSSINSSPKLSNLSSRVSPSVLQTVTAPCFGWGRGFIPAKDSKQIPENKQVGSLQKQLSNHSFHANSKETSPLMTQKSLTKTGVLKTLTHDDGLSVSGQMDVPITIRQDEPVPRPLFGVVVHGKSVPTLICDVNDVPFEAAVKTVLQEMGIETARSIQAWVWPAALSCRHVVGICPPNLGKTMSFVPAVVSQILDQTSYIEVPPGKGPLVLILVPSWKKGRGVLEMVQAFKGPAFSSQKIIKSYVVYAGGIEENENNQMSLMQGCDILIATPHSLLRLLHQDVTSLQRLCHIILDDADDLAARFAKEVDEIMQLFKLQLKERRDQKRCLNVPRQIMIFASKWTAGVEQFHLKYTLEPVIAISSRVEAAVYGGVRQVVKITRQEQVLTTFCRLLDTLSNTRHRVAAFTQEVEEAKQIYQAAISRGVYCLLIHEQLQSENIARSREQWLYSSHSKQLMVMVCTDSCYQDLAITNATMVVHYGLPDSKTKFGNRLACMVDYFRDRTSSIKREIEPVSQIIVTNRCAAKALSVQEMLQRCPTEYSPEFEKFIQGYKMGLENERKTLCPYLKSFGICNDYNKCKHRHVVIPERDLKTGEITKNTLPSSGEVKIKVIHVENASRFYCHIIDHRSVPDNIRTDLRLQYQQLVVDMVSFFSKDSNHVPYIPSDDPFLDGLCAFNESENIFHRAKVLKVDKGSIAAAVECKVWLVDAGYHQTGTIDQLLKLPQRLAEVPYQAVEVYLCCMKPMDDDSEWTYEASTFINSLIQGKELVGRIMLSVGLTLWLLPLVHQVTLKSVGLTSDKNIRQELLDNKFGIPNSEHIQKLYELFRGKTEIPEKLMRQYFDYVLEMEMMQETLSGCDAFYDVNIAAVISPELLYVQKWDNFELLEKLEAQIAEILKPKNGTGASERCKADAEIKLKRGSVCLALSSDGRWYRAKILTDLLSDQWEVFFLDYGDRETVSKTDLKPLPRELAELPCQAIECELAYIQPYGEIWKKQAVDVICDLAYFLNGDKKQLIAKVVSRKEPHYGIGQKLVIDLYEENVRFSQELVWRHVAKCAVESDTLRNLLEKPALKNQLFFNVLDKIPYLCSNIYWCEIHSEVMEQANELCKILTCRDEGWDTNLLEREVMTSAFAVVGYIQDSKAHGILLDCLVSCCVDSDRLTKLAISQNFPCILASCLEQVSRPSTQLQAAQAVAHLVKQKSFSDSLTGCSPLVFVLGQFLKSHEKSPEKLEMLRYLCSASATLVQTVDESTCMEIKSAEMVAYIFTTLKQTSADTEREPWLELLEAIATWESSHKSFMRETHIAAILDLLVRCSCTKCLFYLLSMCELLVQGSRKHKVVLLENKLLIILNELEAGGLGSPAAEVCNRLQKEMALNLPQHEQLAGMPVQHATEVYKIVCPNVTWSQNCFRLLLNVRVQGSKEEDFFISSSVISCRSKTDGVLYEFNWELYDCILPAQSKVKVFSSHSLVSLRKQTKGKWSRLLKEKIKLPNLSLDFEHPYDSEEEDVENDENITKLTQPKDLFNQEHIWRVKRIRQYQSSEESSDELAVYSHDSDDEPAIDMDALMVSNN